MAVRLHRLGLVAAALLVGCFRPAIADGGFACDSTQTEPCPSGFSCVAGFCRSSAPATGGGNVADLSSGGAGPTGANDMSHGGGGPPADLSHASPSDMASGGGSCAHGSCVVGVKLSSGCDPCVTQICAQDNYCCVTKWSAQCVTEVTSICNRTCP